MQQLLQAADSLASAFAQDLERTYEANANNEAVMDSLSDKDKRGTLDWWGAFCRQNTGRSFLDSGGAYGYKYEQPVPKSPLSLEVANGAPSYWSISTPHFLFELLDATDPAALALEELLYWYGENVVASTGWYQTMRTFLDGVLYEMVDFAPRDLTDKEQVFQAIQDMGAYLESLEPEYFNGPRSWDKEYGLPNDWALTFPWKALDLIAQNIPEPGYLGGGNTYNGESDLDQVLQFDTVSLDGGYRGYGSAYIFLQAHTGCDVRGGYTKPIVALMRDYDYFYFFTTNMDCMECGSFWEMAYFYNEDLEESEFDKPPILVEEDEKWVPLDSEGYYSIDAGRIKLLCPKCGNYTVRPSTVAYGF